MKIAAAQWKNHNSALFVGFTQNDFLLHWETAISKTTFLLKHQMPLSKSIMPATIYFD